MFGRSDDTPIEFIDNGPTRFQTLSEAADRNLVDLGSGDDVALGGFFTDEIFGGDGNDVIRGRGSNDRLFGDADDDVLCGGPGNDDLDGGTGANRLYGGAGNDSAVEGAGDETDIIKLGRGDDRAGLGGNGAVDDVTLGAGRHTIVVRTFVEIGPSGMRSNTLVFSAIRPLGQSATTRKAFSFWTRPPRAPSSSC